MNLNVSGLQTMVKKRDLHLHLISDSTGETVHQFARAALAQFPDTNITEHIWTLVRSEAHIDAINRNLEKNPGVVLYSVVNKEVREMLEKLCKKRGIPNLSILDSVVDLFSDVLGTEQSLLSGAQHKLDTAYFKRMAAVEYAVVHDDGLNIENLDDADMLLVGVSRTSKTPTSMYLGHRGFKVANYALVPNVPFPVDRLPKKNIFIVGLTTDPKRLMQVRKTRLQHLSHTNNTNYADIEIITNEVREARKLFNRHGWPIIDVSRRSVEEIAASIIHLHRQWLDKQDNV